MSKKEELLEKLQKRWALFSKADYEVQALFSIDPTIEDLNQIDPDELAKLDKQRSEALKKLIKTREKLRKLEK
jgi:predicted component of type VI protein secretion system